jgi:hypothetical protein
VGGMHIGSEISKADIHLVDRLGTMNESLIVNKKNLDEIKNGYATVGDCFHIRIISGIVSRIRVDGNYLPKEFQKIDMKVWEKIWGKNLNKENVIDEDIQELIGVKYHFQNLFVFCNKNDVGYISIGS